MEDMKKLANVLLYYWPFIKKHKWSTLITFLGYGIGVIVWHVVQPLFYRDLIDVISSPEKYPEIAQTLFGIFLVISLLIITTNILFRIADYFISKFQSEIIRELYNFSFLNLINHSYAFFTNNFAGSLVAKTKRFVKSFETLFDQIVFEFWMTGLQLIGVFISLFIIEPRIGLFFLGWSILFIFIVVILIKKGIPYDVKRSAQDSEVTASLSDVITNILNLKIFTSSKQECNSFSDTTEREHQARFLAWKFLNFRFTIQGILIMVLEIWGLYLVIQLWLQGLISTGTIVIIQFYFNAIIFKMWDIGRTISRFSQTLAEAVEMINIFEIEPDVLDIVQPEISKIKDGKIIFDNISFTYKNGISVFKDFSLTIEPGETVGLVGLSGSGKTTITKLLLRFTNIDEGSIIIDGQNITKISQDDLRRSIAYVPQNPILFHRSIEENIRYGNSEASKDEMINSSKRAHAHDFISSLPQGYATFVGERGIKLSGGECQRVAIARAMLKNSPILILDEATSSLDTISEKYIKEAFEELMRGRTTLVIAHRLSTIKKMKRIIVLDKGKIIEDGSHEELLKKQGLYYKLWNEQVFY